LLDLQIAPVHAEAPEIAWERRRLLRANLERFIAAVQDTPIHARFRQSWMRHGGEESTRRSA
jgi:hypothetical protein